MVIGLIAVLIIIFRVFKSLFCIDYLENKLLVITLFGSIIPLMFSSTLWMNCIFWLWVGCYIKTDFSRKNTFDYSNASEDSGIPVEQIDQIDHEEVIEQGDQL